MVAGASAHNSKFTLGTFFLWVIYKQDLEGSILKVIAAIMLLLDKIKQLTINIYMQL